MDRLEVLTLTSLRLEVLTLTSLQAGSPVLGWEQPGTVAGAAVVYVDEAEVPGPLQEPPHLPTQVHQWDKKNSFKI